MTKVPCPECGGYRDECDCAVALRTNWSVTTEGRLKDMSGYCKDCGNTQCICREINKQETKYPLIEKWLGLTIRNELMTAAYGTPMANSGYVAYVRADDLEAKLREGVQVYSGRGELFNTGYNENIHNLTALTIGQRPIKVKSKEERAMELLDEMVKQVCSVRDETKYIEVINRARKLLKEK